MVNNVLRPIWPRRPPGPSRPTPAVVIPIRTDWRSLMLLANERRLRALEHSANGDQDGYWRLIEDAKAMEAHARRLFAIEEAAMYGRRREQAELSRGASALLEHIERNRRERGEGA